LKQTSNLWSRENAILPESEEPEGNHESEENRIRNLNEPEPEEFEIERCVERKAEDRSNWKNDERNPEQDEAAPPPPGVKSSQTIENGESQEAPRNE